MNDLSQVACIINREGFEAQRGALQVSDTDFLVFGNDAYQSERAKREVSLVRESLAGQATELGFGVDDEGYTWTMLIRFKQSYRTEAAAALRREGLALTLWRAWMGQRPGDQEAGFFERYQVAKADFVIQKMRPKVLQLLGK
jgi:hypothetical protein